MSHRAYVSEGERKGEGTNDDKNLIHGGDGCCSLVLLFLDIGRVVLGDYYIVCWSPSLSPSTVRKIGDLICT